MKKNSFKRNILIAVIALLSVGTYAQNEIAISSAEELQKIGCDEAYPLTGSYFLTGEIDLSEIDEWIPIGAKSEVDGNPAAFEGVFDGKGYAIKNLKISAAGDLKGLFGTLTNAVVKNLTLEVNIKTPNRQVGAVAGSMQGETQIERVSVKGSIEGLENVGGIVGRVYHDNAYELYNKIRNCAVDVHVKATTVQAGGIAGRTNSSLIVENVYVAGKIEAGTTAASQNAAGLVALMTYNFVQFFSSVVVADEITGGTPNLFYSNEAKRYPEYFEDLYARNDISLTYFDNDAKGGGAQIVRNDMLLAPERFRSQSFYQDTLLWDFENVWVMGDDGRPALRTTTGAEQVRTREKVKVACIGNSITENSTVEYAQTQRTDIDMAGARERVRELRSLISALGNVNLDAPRDFEEINERYTFLTAQRKELQEASNKILKAIDEMDEVMVRQFSEMFTRINKELDGVFKALFGFVW